MATHTLRRELAAGAGIVLLVAMVRERLPRVVSVGDVLLLGAVVLLVQALVRDLAHLARARTNPTARQVSCVCIESTLGVAMIVAGAALALGWAPLPIRVVPAAWPIGLAAVLLFGTAVRDVVFDWRTRRVRREPDHGSRVVWRSPR